MAFEVAISLVLLVQAGLLLRTLDVIQRSRAGFSPDNVAVLRVRGMSAGGPALGRLYARYLDQLAAIPSVEAAAVSSGVLPGGPGTPFASLDGADAGRQRSAGYQIVSPGYFAVLRIPLLEGRTFSPDDSADRPAVVIVNQSLARLCWPDGHAVGQRIHGGVGPRETTMTVIGVVGDVQIPLRPGDAPQIYVSYLQQSEPNMAVMVRGRTSLPPIDAVKRAIWSVEARQAMFDIRALDDLVAQSAQGHRVLAELVGSFAILALAISVAGVFTVVTYAIARRIREIAVRRAIGAGNVDVVWLLSRQTLRWSIVGLIVGTAAAVAASRALGAIVPGLVSLDAPIVLTVIAAYVIVITLAMSVPVRRALRIDPATALRAE
jgi:putative ABC transport system permease protein